MQSEALDSPFLAARREWNERYGDYIAQAKNWRAAAILSLATSTVLACGSMYLAGQSKLVPYVVQVDKLGDAVAVARADRATTPDGTVVRAQIASWITDARSVSSDAVAERALLTRVYGCIGSDTKPYLDDWYQHHSPFEAGRTHTVSVAINSVLPQSKTTFDVRWSEEQRDVDGSHPVTTQWEALVSVGFAPPSDEATILSNPLGIYITHVSWTQSLDAIGGGR